MRIGIDIDGVLAEFVEAITKYYNDKYNTSYKKEDYWTYEFWKIWNTTMEEAIKEVFEFSNTTYCDQMSVVEKAHQSILNLSKKHELYAITARDPYFIPKTLKWIEKHFNNIFKEVYFSSNEDLNNKTSKNKNKKEICDMLGIEILVEDSIKNAILCKEGRKIILLEKPWNQKKVDDSNIQKVNNWDEVLEIIEKS